MCSKNKHFLILFDHYLFNLNICGKYSSINMQQIMDKITRYIMFIWHVKQITDKIIRYIIFTWHVKQITEKITRYISCLHGIRNSKFDIQKHINKSWFTKTHAGSRHVLLRTYESNEAGHIKGTNKVCEML